MSTPTTGAHRAADEHRAADAEHSDTDSPSPPVELAAARTPTGAPAAAPWAILFALAVLALGVVGVRDALVAAGAFGGSSWTQDTADVIDGLRPRPWMIPAGIVLALLGLWWLLAAVKPRKRPELFLSGDPGAWMRPADLARLARTAAEHVDGVVSVRTSATRRAVTIKATTTARDTTEVRTALTDAVTDHLDSVDRAPKVKVKARDTGGSR